MPKASQTEKPARLGCYSRGLETRAKIIKVAVEMFGRHGFDQASTRAIATKAKVNLGALQYYFGSKRKLYRACAEYIADAVGPRIDELAVISAASVATGDGTPNQQFEALEKFLAAAIDRLLLQGPSSDWLQFINREQMWPGPGFDILYERVIRRLVGALASLVAPIIGEPPGSEAVVLQTVAMLGPLFIFQRASVVALRPLDWPDFRGDRFDRVKAILIRQSLRGIVAPVAPTRSAGN